MGIGLMFRWCLSKPAPGFLCLLTAASLAAGPRVGADQTLPPVVVQVDEFRSTDSSPFSPANVSQGAGIGRSVSTLGAEDIRNTQGSVVSDLAEALPGLTTLDATSRQTSLFVRGQGVTALNDGLTGSVGLFIDGFYLGRPSYAGLGLFDLEEVGLLRGASDAQGGPGSIAGELRLKTNEPSSRPSAEVSSTIGNLGYRRITGFINGPLDGKTEAESRWSGRLSFDRQVRDGLLTNVFDNTKINNQDRLGLRGQVAFKASSRLKFKLAADYGVLDQQCCSFPLIGAGSAATQARDAYMGYERVGGDPQSREVDTDTPPSGKLVGQGLALTTEWRVGDDQRWVSLTGYRSLRYSKNLNDDASSIRLISGALPTQSYQFTQETRWHRDTERSRQVAGLFLMNERIRGSEQAFFQDEVFTTVAGGLLREQVPFLTRQNSGLLLDTLVPPQTFDGFRLDGPYSQTSNTASLFGSSSWRLGERNQVGAGLRGTLVDRRAAIARMQSGGNLSASPLSLTNSLQPLADATGADFGPLTFSGLVDMLVGEEFSRTDRRRDYGASGRLGFERAIGEAPTDPLRASIALAQGYKAGGLNLVGLTGIAKPEFQQETSTGLELGLKGSVVFQGRRRGDFALNVYRTYVRDYQALTYTTSEGLISTPRQNNILNIPKVTLTGFEAETLLGLPRRMSLGLAVAYNRAISEDFPNAPNAETMQSDKDLGGEQLYNAPVWVARASLGQALPLEGRSLVAYWGVDHTYRSSYNLTVEKNPNTQVRAHGLTDLRLGLRKPRGLATDWAVEGFVKNLTDEEYLGSAVALYGLGDYGGLAGDPRMLGITLTVGLGN